MNHPVIIFGAKGLGVSALEIFQSHDIVVYGFLDDDSAMHGKEINFISVLGRTDDDGFLKLIGHKCEAFVATDENKYRKSLVEMLNTRRKVMPVNAVHSKAVMAQTSQIGHGNLINAGAVVNAMVQIGSHCVLNSNCLVDSLSVLGDFVQIGAGSIVNSNVTIEEGAFIGSGVTIVSGVKIGKNARVGAGSVVISDVKANSTVFGNPAEVMAK